MVRAYNIDDDGEKTKAVRSVMRMDFEVRKGKGKPKKR